MVVGTAYGALYLAFAVAVVAAVAGFVRSQIATVFAALGSLIALPILAGIDALRPWLPSELLTAVIGMVGGDPVTHDLRAAAVAVVATTGLLALAVRRIERREL